MKIILRRLYGDDRVTKSQMTVESDGGEVLMQCEAHEPRYADYTEVFPGCSRYCLAVGTWPCRVKATAQSAMTVIVPRSPGHRSTCIGWDEWKQWSQNVILIGMGDEETDIQYRRLREQKETFRRFERLVYRAYTAEEKIIISIKNGYEVKN